jgi:hypothetical protein
MEVDANSSPILIKSVVSSSTSASMTGSIAPSDLPNHRVVGFPDNDWLQHSMAFKRCCEVTLLVVRDSAPRAVSRTLQRLGIFLNNHNRLHCFSPPASLNHFRA